MITCHKGDHLNDILSAAKNKFGLQSTLFLACHGNQGFLELGAANIHRSTMSLFKQFRYLLKKDGQRFIIVGACNVAQHYFNAPGARGNTFCSHMARLTGATVVATGTYQVCDIDYDNLAATCTEGPIEGKAIAFYPTLETKELGQNLSVSKILDKLKTNHLLNL